MGLFFFWLYFFAANGEILPKGISSSHERSEYLILKSEERWDQLAETKKSQIEELFTEAYADFLANNRVALVLPDELELLDWQKLDTSWMRANDLDLWVDNISIVFRSPDYSSWVFRTSFTRDNEQCNLTLTLYEAVFRPSCILRSLAPNRCEPDRPLMPWSWSELGEELSNRVIAEMTGTCRSPSSTEGGLLGFSNSNTLRFKKGFSTSQDRVQ